MTTKVTVTTEVVCDLPCRAGQEHEAGRRIRFGLGADRWELDACEMACAEMARVMAPFTAAARPDRRHLGKRPAASRRRAAQIRQWAAGQGLPVTGKGRIPAKVLAAYEHREAGNA